MALTAEPSFASRTSPVKLASAPTSLRPRVIASSSRPVSKSASWMRTVGTLAPGHRREECDLVAGFHRRGEVRHLLVDGDAPRFSGREGLAPQAVTIAKLVDERRDRRAALVQRELLA